MSVPEQPNDRQDRRDREDRAQKLAVDTALRNQKVDSRLDAHEVRLNNINASQSEMVKVQRRMQEIVDRIESKIDTATAVAKASADAAKQNADKSVSTRNFFLGCAGVVASLGALLAGTGHA